MYTCIHMYVCILKRRSGHAVEDLGTEDGAFSTLRPGISEIRSHLAARELTLRGREYPGDKSACICICTFTCTYIYTHTHMFVYVYMCIRI